MEHKPSQPDWDELQSLWKKDIETGIGTSPLHDQAQLNQLIMKVKQESTSAWSALQRKIILEIGAAILIVILGYFISRQMGRNLPVLFWVGILVLSCSGHLFYYFRMRKLEATMGQDLKTALTEQAKIGQSFLLMCERGMQVLMSFLFMSLLFVIGMQDQTIFVKIVLGVIALAACFGLLAWTKAYIDRLYGKNLKQIEACLTELEV